MLIPLAELTQATVPSNGAVAVMPLGAIESHGPHLPLGTDVLIAEGILDRVAQFDRSRAPFLRLPPLWLGASAEHADQPGTLSADPEGLIAQVVNVGLGLSRAGVDRVVLFNAHGGNVAALSIAALKLRTRCGMLAANAHWCDFGLPPDLTPPSPPAEDVHGGWMETSILLHIAPTLVSATACTPCEAVSPGPSLFPRGPIAWGWTTGDLAPEHVPSGWVGRPDLATADLGRALVDHAARGLLKLLQDLAAAEWPRRKSQGPAAD